MSGEDVIQKRREERVQTEIRVKQIAEKVYEGFDDNEKGMVAFGMFPFEKMKTADELLKAEFEFIHDQNRKDLTHKLTCALMGIHEEQPKPTPKPKRKK